MKNIALVLLVFFSCSAFAKDMTIALLDFMKANDGKFETEIKEVGGIGVNSIVTIRTKNKYFGTGSEYDAKNSTFTLKSPYLETSIMVYKGCKNVGSYMGESIYGKRYAIQEVDCTIATLENTDYSDFKFGDSYCELFSASEDSFPTEDKGMCRGVLQRMIKLKVSPDEFRAIKKSGVIYEIDFQVGMGAKQEIIEKRLSIAPPTIGSQSYQRTTDYNVYGKIEKIRLFSSDGKRLLVQYPRDINGIEKPKEKEPIPYQ